MTMYKGFELKSDMDKGVRKYYAVKPIIRETSFAYTETHLKIIWGTSISNLMKKIDKFLSIPDNKKPTKRSDILGKRFK